MKDENAVNGNTVILKKPVMAHGEEVTEITLREPTGEDIHKHGFPFTVDNEGRVILIGNKVIDYIGVLGQIPPSAAKSMGASDINDASWIIAGFFLQG